MMLGNSVAGHVIRIEGCLSRIQTLTSKITQICQDIRDIKLRRLLITQSDKEQNEIANILTNQSDCKNTWGSNRSRPGTPDIHEGHAEGDIYYTYKTPNHHEHGNWDNLQRHETYRPQRPPEPSGMIPEPLPYPDPSEASERSSSPPTSLSSLPKKDNVRVTAYDSLEPGV